MASCLVPLLIQTDATSVHYLHLAVAIVVTKIANALLEVTFLLLLLYLSLLQFVLHDELLSNHNNPVALVCTSGSALINYFPAL
jgi:hypothetical protein